MIVNAPDTAQLFNFHVQSFDLKNCMYLIIRLKKSRSASQVIEIKGLMPALFGGLSFFAISTISFMGEPVNKIV